MMQKQNGLLLHNTTIKVNVMISRMYSMHSTWRQFQTVPIKSLFGTDNQKQKVFAFAVYIYDDKGERYDTKGWFHALTQRQFPVEYR